MDPKAIEKIFPGTDEKRKKWICPLCGHIVVSLEEFKDEQSVKEFKQSGMCQRCQDSFFK